MMKFLSTTPAGIAVAMLGMAIATSACQAADTVVMTTGEVGSAMITFALSKEASPRTILIRTNQAGVTGSVLSVYVDQAKTPTFRHTFAEGECSFPSGSPSVCIVTIPQTASAYADIVSIFRAGKEARFVVEDGGVMAMDYTASLIGFSKSFDE